MADTVAEKIQPCLFDRLTDEEPDARQDSRASRVISIQRYRDGVLRDLRWLLNASAHLDDEDRKQFREVRHSVLNFGVNDLCGQMASNLELAAVEQEIFEAIKCFEPRIIPGTLSVRALSDFEKVGPNCLGFEIRGELWASPMPEQLYIRTQIDLDTGECVL
jgi:type VI secretion system protein ImpF